MGGGSQQHEEGKAVETKEQRQRKNLSKSPRNLKKYIQRWYKEVGKVSKDVHTEKKAVGSSSSSELVVRFSASRNSKSAISCHHTSRMQPFSIELQLKIEKKRTSNSYDRKSYSKQDY